MRALKVKTIPDVIKQVLWDKRKAASSVDRHVVVAVTGHPECPRDSETPGFTVKPTACIAEAITLCFVTA